MTAAKVLSAVRTVMIHRRNGGALAEDWPNRLADIWAAGEAAAALAFASARLCDILDVGGNSAESRKGVELVVPCAKLFATAHASRFLLDAISLIGPSALVEDAPYFLGGLASDAVVEAMYLGPESVQRRQIVAALNADAFDSSLDDWLSESHQEARQPETGARSLAAGMELWRFVLGHLKGRRDDRGVALCSDANQGTAFLLADALCLLLAAQSLVRGVGGLRDSDARQHLEAPIHFFTDLGAAHAARVAGMVGQSCTELFFGCAHRFRFSEQELREFGALRARLDISLSGSADARNRAAQFVRAVASA
ncbi:MAG: hypothetical protein M1570_12435 [Chloroflexi bacterium]|nr:hypothetical protein [Chloroflexota bacterium]